MLTSQSLLPAPRRRRLWMASRSPESVSFLLAFLCLVLLLGPWASPAVADPPPDEAAGPWLHSFKIIGAKLVPAKKLKAEMTTPLPSILPWKHDPVFKKDDLEGDLVRLKDYYRRQGFYHTTIVPQIETADNRVKVEIHITEGPYVQVVHEEVATAPTTPPWTSPPWNGNGR